METETYEQYHAHYVAQGIAVLDAFRPDWRGSVDADRINIASPMTCVLGQVFYREWRRLDLAWQREVAAWRDADKAGPCPRSDAGHSPYGYGLRLLYIAAGGNPEDFDVCDQWAADHGFLSGERVDVSRWSDDDDDARDRMPLFERMLTGAWKRALTV